MNSKRNTQTNTRQSEHHSVNSVHNQEPSPNNAPPPNFVTRQDLDAFAATITTRFQESLQQAVRTLPNILQPQQQSIRHSACRQTEQVPTFNQQNPRQDQDFWIEDVAESQKSPYQRTLGSRRPTNSPAPDLTGSLQR